jgi:ferric-chelate reductase
MHWRGLKHATGVSSIFNLMFTALPVTKTSIWMHLIGLSYERAVKFHRFLARYTVGIMWVHFVLQAKHFGIGEVFSGSAGDHDTLCGILALVCFASMAFSALEVVRRAKYELFRYLHYLAPLGFVFVFLHTPASVYLWGVVGLYAIDHGLRW